MRGASVRIALRPVRMCQRGFLCFLFFFVGAVGFYQGVIGEGGADRMQGVMAVAPETDVVRSEVKADAEGAEQQAFIDQLLPQVNAVNRDILRSRQRLLSSFASWRTGAEIPPRDQVWLRALAGQYAMPQADFQRRVDWEALIARVDIVPPSLVLAQAINESDWGRSRFAMDAQNYFGKQCTVPGCGIIPKERPSGAVYEIKRYSSARASVYDYVLNLNTRNTYLQLRKIRAGLRRAGKPLTGAALAPGLTGYSVRGQAYVDMLLDIIRNARVNHGGALSAVDGQITADEFV